MNRHLAYLILESETGVDTHFAGQVRNLRKRVPGQGII